MRSQSLPIVAQLIKLSRENANRASYLIVSIAMFGVFIFDLILPLGVAAAALYALVVCASMWIRGNTGTYVIAAIGLLFTILGFFLSSDIVSTIEAVIINRLLAALLIIVTAIMVLKIKKAEIDISTLMTQSVMDPLTQAKNWRAFGQELENEIVRNKRYHRSLSVAIIDIDHLAMINQVCNNDFGDSVINKVAKEILNNIRRCDVLYRLDGGKFAILFAETGMQEAKRVGEVICKKISSKIRLTDHEITVSVGIATLDAEDSKRVLCQRAEEALLQSKGNGRNRVSTSPPVSTKTKETSRVAAILSRSRFKD